jgi:preprotein translocase YajC subunit
LGNFGLLALYVAGFIAIFYFLAIRPQQRQRKTHEALISRVKRGDRVVTIGGIHGKIKRTEDEIITLEIAKGVDIRIARKSIAEVTDVEGGEAPQTAQAPAEIEPPEVEETSASDDVIVAEESDETDGGADR